MNELAEFVDRYDLEFLQIADPDSSVWRRFGDDVSRSSFLIIDDTGATERTGYGQLDEAALRARVEALLAG